MTADTSNSRSRCLIKCPQVKCDRTLVISLLKHSCWSAIILGGIMLALGIVLRSSVINNQSNTVTSSGLLFILIGIFIICMGPFAAIYDLIAQSRSSARRRAESRMRSTRPSHASDPPSYNQVMTSYKTPSFTYSMRFSELSAKDLSNSVPPPPSYEEVAAKENILNPNKNISPDTRRMTAP